MKALSVVTVTRNDYDQLKITLDTVRKNNSLEFEYIVIDGNSDDETKKLVENNLDLIDIFLSEKDNGIYHAMNKGLKIASGKFILFLNSGDRILNLSKVIKDINNFSQNEKKILLYASEFSWSESMSKIITPHFSFCTMPTSHQAMIFPNDIAKQLEYNLSYKYSADYDLYLRILKQNNFLFEAYEDVIVKTAPVGFTSNSIFDYLKECYKINLKYNSKSLSIIRFLLELTKLQIKKFINKFFNESFIAYLRKLRGGF